MQISLHKLNQAKDGQLVIRETVALDTMPGEVPGLIRLAPVEVEARVTRLDPHLIEADAEEESKATFTCSRCLQEFETPVHVKWTELFTDEAHRAVETEEQEIHYFEGNELDLSPYIREALMLQLPYIPVCREDCKGLCPKCGVNKNADSCNCQVEKIDPRLAALQDWLDQNK
ncbi:DUF177 domain-containing protein [Laceyella sacchari]|jgi:uncharacterized protein|uniref:DUF177 domain-containing protein n=2 Tax=Laceyella TaxID=292635 RepID=A0AA45WL38_9BACL|nr:MULTISPECIES: DUF177 domain-containing protein [Laceyella]AUS09275.1 DUF177 domain-containing protein [Laceyella sacchari]KPC74905.1 hypothetical protein ADL26_10955 [Thermoactinomyces vulgaris]MRG29068.1 hypothetical protein [Laceyella tengchongensis]PRZ13659.1 uncharacterized protein CLV36_108156 [Laceyella sediminis]SMP09965.1 uncharacterized protein SAMN06265361_102139 [Laceyella tengchongensis]